MKNYSTIIMFGATSDIGWAILESIPLAPNPEIILVGKTNMPPSSIHRFTRNSFIMMDLEDTKDIAHAISQLPTDRNIDLVIVAAGYLPPEHQDLNPSSLEKVFRINGLGIPLLVSSLINQLRNRSKTQILLISTIAVVRPRLMNFSYSASKEGADFFCRGLSRKYRKSGIDLRILRPGFVFTKMTVDLNPAPFAITTQRLSRIAISGLAGKKKVIYAPRLLWLLVPVLKFLPSRILDKLQ